LSRIGTVIPSVPVVDSYQKIKQVIKCYLLLHCHLSSTDIQDIFDLIEQANTKYFNKDMMSEFYALKGVAYAKLHRHDDANKLFSCATQLADSNLPRLWIHWADFLLDKQTILTQRNTNDDNDHDESILICYLNACKDLNEIKARSILAKVFYLLSRDHEQTNNNRLSNCIERYVSSIPVQHWLFWLPQIMSKLLRNESSSAMLSILTELVRVYPQTVYVHMRRSRMTLLQSTDDSVHVDDTFMSSMSSNETSLPMPVISVRQQAMNYLTRLEQILFEQHPTIVRTLQLLVDQLQTINETFYEYVQRRLYQCQRRIYEDLFVRRTRLADDVRTIIEHLKDVFAQNSEQTHVHSKQMHLDFVQDFNDE
jgi:hypothetical protein